MKLISIVLSFRNEEKNLPEPVTRISTTIKKSQCGVIKLKFVNRAIAGLKVDG